MSTFYNPPDSILNEQFKYFSPTGSLHPFEKLDVGESFYRPVWKRSEVKSCQDMIYKHTKKHPSLRFRHKVYRIGPKAYGIRIWRTS